MAPATLLNKAGDVPATELADLMNLAHALNSQNAPELFLKTSELMESCDEFAHQACRTLALNQSEIKKYRPKNVILGDSKMVPVI